MIPVVRPDIGEEEIEAVSEVLRSGMIAQGRRVAELEERWAEFVGVRHAIAIANGTLALMAIYAALDLKPGDEVITVSHSFNATGSAVLSTGATPVFIDIEPDTYNMDAGLIEAAITPRTRAICPVDLFGLPADMPAIAEIADRHGLTVVEDACQAHGATIGGRRTGSFGHGAFSLYGTKNMTTGEGGFVTTDDDRVADWIRLYRNQGMRERYHHEILGYNYRLTDVAAAIGLVQLGKLERNTERRRAIARRYDEGFAGSGIGTPVVPDGRTHVYHQYTVDVGEDRDAIVVELTVGRHRDRHLLSHPRPPPALHRRARDPRRPARHRSRRRALAVVADAPEPERGGPGDGHRGRPSGRRTPARPRGERGSMTSRWAPAGERELRVGLIGLGSMGRNHLRILSSMPGARLVAVADPDRDALDGATAGNDAQGFAEPMALLGEADLDAVVIASPTTTHVALALAAIERGVATLVEKPLAATPEEAAVLVDAAGSRGVPLQVGHVERFNPAVLELGRLLHDGGWLSSVYAITSRRAGPFPARIRDVGVTVDLATHDVDILSWIAGERPVRVFAETAQRIHADHEDLLFGLMSFPSGTVAMLDVDWLTPAKRRQLAVVGEEGMFELDYLTQRLTFTRASDMTNPRLIGGYAPTFAGETVELPVSNEEPLAVELAAFLGVVRNGGRPVVDGEDGRWAVVLAHALLTAAREQRTVELVSA